MDSSVVMTHPYSLGAPGGGTLGCIEIARHLQLAGVKVVLVSVLRGPETPPEPGMQVRTVPTSLVHHWLDGLAVARAVRAIAGRERVKAVIGWTTEVAFLPGMLRSRGITFGMIAAMPSYSTWFESEESFGPLRRKVADWFRRRPLRQADAVFALSRFTRDELINVVGLNPEKIAVTYWGVDPALAQIPREHTGEIRRLIFYGNLGEHKGVFDALNALGRVAAQGSRNWVLKIAGWGDVTRVRRTAEQQGIMDRVVLLGALDHRSLARELPWAQLAILPSRIESFGLAIAEAQAAGLPVVSCRAGSIPEVVEDGVTARLVPCGDVAALSEAILETMKDPDRAYRMGLAGRQRVLEKFSWQKTAEQILTAIGHLQADRATHSEN